MKYIPYYDTKRPVRSACLALSVMLGSSPSFAGNIFDLNKATQTTITKSANVKLTLELDGLSTEYQIYLLTASSSSGGVSGFSSQRTMAQINAEKVLIDAIAASNPQQLKTDLESMGAEVTGVAGHIISALVPLNQLPALETMDSLQFARPVLAYTRAGSVTSQGDQGQRSDLARNFNGIDGAGSTVGILSDSFNCSGNGSYAADIASEDLPLGVNILQDLVSGCSDEGRAMAQIVHDVAPGAGLAFHTAFTGEAGFAQGILDLAAIAGADVIVDDVGYFAAPMFQDGVVAQAVDTVTAAGVSYFSSAGNSGREAYQATFINSGIAGPFGGPLHDFNPGLGVDTRLTIQQNADTIYSMQWQNPFFSVSGAPGATTDLDICFYSPVGAASPFACFSNTNIGGDPVEIGTVNGTGALEISIESFSGTNPGLVKIAAFGSISFPENHPGINAGTVYGQNNAAGANAVGASAYFLNPAFGETPPVLNNFSSAGSTPILFDTSGNPVNVTREKPEFTAPDGGNNTFFGGDFEPDGLPNFFGTSAAAPHAAGVAALMREVAPGLSPNQITTVLQNTAIDMLQRETLGFGGPRVAIGIGFDNDSGSGLIDADAAVAAVLPSPDADLSITKIDSADPVMAGSMLDYTITVNNAGSATATGVQVSEVLPAGVTFLSTTGCNNDPGGVAICNLSDIPAGGSAQFTITVEIDQATGGIITNNATVSSAVTDPSLANNQISEDTLVTQYGDIDLDGCIGRNDVRQLLTGIRSGSPNSSWDFNGDSVINRADGRTLVQLYTFANGSCTPM